MEVKRVLATKRRTKWKGITQRRGVTEDRGDKKEREKEMIDCFEMRERTISKCLSEIEQIMIESANDGEFSVEIDLRVFPNKKIKEYVLQVLEQRHEYTIELIGACPENKYQPTDLLIEWG